MPALSFQGMWLDALLSGRKKRGVELEVWAAMWSYADGFNTFLDANEWFTMNYGDDWMDRTWHVIRWDGWLERYFLADGE